MSLIVDSISEMLENDIEARELAAIVDDVTFDYVDGLLRNSDVVVPGQHQADAVYWMRRLRDALMAASG